MPTATPRKTPARDRDPASPSARPLNPGQSASAPEAEADPVAEGSTAAANSYDAGARAFAQDTERVDRAAIAAAAGEVDDGIASGMRSSTIRVRHDGKTWCVEHPTLIEAPHFARLEAAEARANDLAKVLGAAIIVRGQDGELLATYPARAPE